MDHKKIGKELKARRAYLSMTQQELSDSSGVSLYLVMKAENNPMGSSVYDLEKIAKALNYVVKLKLEDNG